MAAPSAQCFFATAGKGGGAAARSGQSDIDIVPCTPSLCEPVQPPCIMHGRGFIFFPEETKKEISGRKKTPIRADPLYHPCGVSSKSRFGSVISHKQRLMENRRSYCSESDEICCGFAAMTFKRGLLTLTALQDELPCQILAKSPQRRGGAECHPCFHKLYFSHFRWLCSVSLLPNC